MSKSARSVFVFAIYLFVLGATLVVAPGLIIRAFGFPEPDDLWIRIVGMLVIILGFYYSHAAHAEFRAFFGWTVIARTAVPLFFITFVLAGLAPPILVLFGLVDFAAALWTFLALRSEARSR
jgi:hypothetical protein